MGTVYRKSATKPLPAGARIIVRKGQRFAEWFDAKEKRRTAPVTVGQEGAARLERSGSLPKWSLVIHPEPG
jgi:hypothetical protein